MVQQSSLWKCSAVLALAGALVGCATAPGTEGNSTANTAAAALPAPAPPPEVSLADLIVGADWAAVRIEGIGVLGTPVPRLRWISATQVTGNGGCNQFSGKAVVGDANFTLGPLASTRMLCMPTPSGQEDKFFKALESTTRARLERGVLVLLDGQGNELMRLTRQGR